MLLQKVLWATAILILMTGCSKRVRTTPAGIIILKNIDGEPCRDGDYQQYIAPGVYWCVHDCESMDLWDYQKKGCVGKI